MARATYFLGGKRVVSKKNGVVYNFVTLLSKNRFGDWQTKTLDCDSNDTLDLILDEFEIGQAVKVRKDDDDYLCECSLVDSIPALDLYGG